MREIKFRVWRMDNKKISKSFNLIDFAIDQDGEHGDCFFSLDSNENGKIIKNILMQYTGLLDKNGVEIYEGDIVKDGGGNYKIEWQEEWDDYDCSFSGYTLRVTNPKNCEVIGNIYENPELLK